MEHRQRTGRRIKFNHSNATPRHIISFDCETRPDETSPGSRVTSHRFRLATTAEVTLRKDRPRNKIFCRFTTQQSVWNYITSLTGLGHTTWLVGHNVLFDLVVSGFPDQMMQGRFTIDWPRAKRKREGEGEDDPHNVGLCCIESPPTIIALRCSKTQGRLVIVDSLNWFPVPLSEMGDACGLPKGKMPEFSAPDDDWFSYCERDSDIVLETMINLIDWVRDNNCGMFRYTAASQAYAAYRHRFMRKQILVHDSGSVKRLERSAYIGGRTEVFRLGSFACMVHQLDINSLFPHVMRNGRFPSLLDKYDDERSLSHTLPDIAYADSVAEVEINTLDPIFPCKRDGVTVYPVGRFTTFLCGHELHYAVDKGYVKQVGRYAQYKCDDLFSLWVDELWGLRQSYKESGNRLYEQFAKRLLNSLYGKFGQRAPGWVNCPGDLSGLPWTKWIGTGEMPNEVVNFRSIGWNIQRQTDRGEIEGSFVAISAFVTSAARMYMNAIRWTAGVRDCFYQGVDSVMVSDAGLERLQAAGMVGDTELGKLRLQCSSADGEILGCADYRIGDKVVIAGRARAMTVGEEGEQLQRKFDATRNLFSGRPIDYIDETLEPWTRAGLYRKGSVGEDGWVHPHILGICEAAMAHAGVPF